MKINLTVPEIYCLVSIFIVTNPRTDTERAILIPTGQISDMFAEADLDLRIISSLVEKGLIAQNHESSGYSTTRLGSSFVIKCKSFTPDFKRLAEEDITTAFAMFFRGFDGLAGHVGTNKIKPGKDNKLVDALFTVRDWINNNVESGENDGSDSKEVTSFTEIAGPPKSVRKRVIKPETPKVDENPAELG